jgi:hypothetical protein
MDAQLFVSDDMPASPIDYVQYVRHLTATGQRLAECVH